jgi:hypothetical protein
MEVLKNQKNNKIIGKYYRDNSGLEKRILFIRAFIGFHPSIFCSNKADKEVSAAYRPFF